METKPDRLIDYQPVSGRHDYLGLRKSSLHFTHTVVRIEWAGSVI